MGIPQRTVPALVECIAQVQHPNRVECPSDGEIGRNNSHSVENYSSFGKNDLMMERGFFFRQTHATTVPLFCTSGVHLHEEWASVPELLVLAHSSHHCVPRTEDNWPRGNCSSNSPYHSARQVRYCRSTFHPRAEENEARGEPRWPTRLPSPVDRQARIVRNSRP